MAATGLEFKNVVFNAARDGKLRRLKVCGATRCPETSDHLLIFQGEKNLIVFGGRRFFF